MNRAASWLDQYFQIAGRGTTISRECLAGCVTFGAMAYIMAVNPAIMASVGLPREAMVLTTIAGTVAGTLIMALWARLPIALAPAMSSNALFAQVIVQQAHVSPFVAFTAILFSGLAFTLISLTKIRHKIVSHFPPVIITGIQLAIGAFIARLGLIGAGIAAPTPHGLGFGSLLQPSVIMEMIAIFCAFALTLRRAPGGLLWLIGGITLCGLIIPGPDGLPFTHLPEHFLNWPHYPAKFFWPFDFRGYFANIGILLPITLYVLLSDFFDATGTLISVATRAGLCGTKQHPHLNPKAYACDGAASVTGVILGTCTVSAYVESLAGVEAGGRTGLCAVVVAILFALSSFLWPLLSAIPTLATAPILALVGVNLLGAAARLSLNPEETAAPLLMLLISAVTGNFMLSLACGMLLYSGLEIAMKRFSSLTPTLIGLDLAFVCYMALQAHF